MGEANSRGKLKMTCADGLQFYPWNVREKSRIYFTAHDFLRPCSSVTLVNCVSVAVVVVSATWLYERVCVVLVGCFFWLRTATVWPSHMCRGLVEEARGEVHALHEFQLSFGHSFLQGPNFFRGAKHRSSFKEVQLIATARLLWPYQKGSCKTDTCCYVWIISVQKPSSHIAISTILILSFLFYTGADSLSVCVCVYVVK